MGLTGNLFKVTTTNYLDSNVYYVYGANPGLVGNEQVALNIAGFKYTEEKSIINEINSRDQKLDYVQGFFTNKEKSAKKEGDGVLMRRNLGSGSASSTEPGEPPLLFKVTYNEKMEKWALAAVGIGVGTAAVLGASAVAVTVTSDVGIAVALWASEAIAPAVGEIILSSVIGIVGAVTSPAWLAPAAIAGAVVAIGGALFFAFKGKSESLSEWDGFPITYEPLINELGRHVPTVSAIGSGRGAASGAAPGNSELTNQFLFYVSDIFISVLASQTKITNPRGRNPFADALKEDVLPVLDRFYNSILNNLKRSTQFKMLDACDKALQPTGPMSIERQIESCKKSIEGIIQKAGGSESYLNQEQKTAIKVLSDGVKGLMASKIIVSEFRDKILKYEVNKVFNPSGLDSNIGQTPTSFGKFMQKFTTYFIAYYDALEKTPASAARQKAGTDAINKEKAKSLENAKKSKVISSVEQDDFERKAARAAGEAQIIQVSGSKVELGSFDTFISDKPREDQVFYNQINTVLDVFKNDTQNTPLFSAQLATETNSPANLSSTVDSSSACTRILESMSPTARNALVVALKGKKALSLKKVFSSLVTIKQLQSDPMFKISGYFTGFGGFDFTKLATLPLGADIDPKALKSVIGIEGFKSSIESANRLLATLNVGSMANSYLGQLGALTHAFTDPITTAIDSMSVTMTSVDLKAALKNASAQDLAKCPSISQLQNYVYNPNFKGTDALKLLKTNTNSVNLNITQQLNSIEDQFGELEKIQSQSERIEKSLEKKASQGAEKVTSEASARSKNSINNLNPSVNSLTVDTDPKTVPTVPKAKVVSQTGNG